MFLDYIGVQFALAIYLPQKTVISCLNKKLNTDIKKPRHQSGHLSPGAVDGT